MPPRGWGHGGGQGPRPPQPGGRKGSSPADPPPPGRRGLEAHTGRAGWGGDTRACGWPRRRGRRVTVVPVPGGAPPDGWEHYRGKAPGARESDGHRGPTGALSTPEEGGYLFRWSRRKRKVSRLASGSDSSRLSMQLSFATGSESAAWRGLLHSHNPGLEGAPQGPGQSPSCLPCWPPVRALGGSLATLDAFSEPQSGGGYHRDQRQGCWAQLPSWPLGSSHVLLRGRGGHRPPIT